MHKSIFTVTCWEDSISQGDMKRLRDKIDDFMSSDKFIKDEWITLEVSSSGGNCEAVYAFYDWIKSKNLKIQTLGIGQVSSMGVILFLTGEYRVIGANTIMYLHEPSRTYSSGASHTVSQSKWNLESLSFYHNTYINIVHERLNKKKRPTRNKLEKMLKNEKWLTAKEAVELGFADEIV